MDLVSLVIPIDRSPASMDAEAVVVGVSYCRASARTAAAAVVGNSGTAMAADGLLFLTKQQYARQMVDR